MSTKKKHAEQTTESAPEGPLWIESLATAARLAQPDAESTIRTRLSFDIHAGKPSLFVPTDMAELQPAGLRYLHAFAQHQGLTLVEDRRWVEIMPGVEKRNTLAPMIATGISLMMKQTGLPGIAKALSDPHRLNANSPCIPLPRLIRMAASAAKKSKRVVFAPNRMIGCVLDDDTQPIAGYACKLLSERINTVLSQFDSTNFRAIGYSTGRQYVMHVCLAGGPLVMPSLWTNFHTLSRTEFQFQLYPGKQANRDFGLLYATYYLDMTQAPRPWWLNTDFKNYQPVTAQELHQKAS